MKRQAVLLLCVALVSTSGLWAASFDCAKARSKVEKAICGDPELSKLDEQLAAAYKNALAIHPLPSYVRARQIEWLKLLPYVDGQHFVSSLKQEYSVRINHLKNASQAAVYSDAQVTFSYGGGDTVAELWQSDGKWRLSIWGGFQLDRVNSEANGRDAFEGCEFEGTIKEPFTPEGKNSTVGKEGEGLSFGLTRQALSFGNAPAICVGHGRIHLSDLKRVLKALNPSESLTGTYNMKGIVHNLGDNGQVTDEARSGTLAVVGQPGGKVRFLLDSDIVISAAEGKVNVGEALGEIEFHDSRAVYAYDRGKYDKCSIVMKVISEDKIEVSQEYGCGFGVGVDASGAYVKVSKDVPKLPKEPYGERY